jgi:ornithine carbamoyltransferase
MHLLSLRDLSADRLEDLVQVAVAASRNGFPPGTQLTGKLVGLLFCASSTRTRTSFAAGAIRLGASIIQYRADDLQLATDETNEDTGNVLSQYLDALVIRTNGPDEEMREFARQSTMSVINAMSRTEHPTQAIADLTTIMEVTGQLRGRHIVYFGEGNNTAAALALAVALTPGMQLTLMTPPEYGLAGEIWAEAERLASRHGSEVTQRHDPSRLPPTADVVYTTRWQTMGVAHPEPDWRSKFVDYRVTRQIFNQLDNGRTIFMHDLPAVRGDECDAGLLDGERSVALRQARNKMAAAMAVLIHLIGH